VTGRFPRHRQVPPAGSSNLSPIHPVNSVTNLLGPYNHLTPKGVQVALLFLFFHKRLCGPLANSRFRHCPDTHYKPASKLEAAYHRADKAIQQIVDLLAA
jgi:hypothetical protein